MSLNLIETITRCLKSEPERKFTARDIATWIFENYPDECRQKQMRSTATVIPLNSDDALIQQIVAEIGSTRPILQKRYPQVKNTEGRPRRYYFSEATESAEINLAEGVPASPPSARKGPVAGERELYGILSEFLWSEFKIHSKRIDEKRSSNFRGTGGNKWLHPDLVGMEDLGGDWHSEVRNCVQEYTDKRTKLWSFEVKILVNGSNVREVFFQTVSNSSWANYSYLAASEISGANTLKELRMLASSHGVGFIRLNVENPSESEVTIPAAERSEIDWNIVNRLVEENKDFLNYIKLIRHFYQTGDILANEWDTPVDGE